MNNRLTTQEVACLLADYTGKDRQHTESFLKEFIAVVSDNVCVDKLVKVKGLGTFKVVPVESRSSIHVGTGNRFVIAAHCKFSFLPDKELKELINKPFSFFDTVELNDGVDFSDLDAQEEEEEEKDADDESIEEVVPNITELEQPIPQPIEQPIEQLVEETVEEPVPIKEPIEEPVLAPVIESYVPETETYIPVIGLYVEEETSRSFEAGVVGKSRSFYVIRIIMGLSVFALLLVGAIFIYLNTDSLQWNSAPKTANVSIAEEPVSPVSMPDSSFVEADTVPPTIQPLEVKEETAAKPVAKQAALAIVKIKPGSMLTVIALEYYGSKTFWVYIYEHNKAKIKNPNNVPIGTELEIPAPELYGIDVHNRASIEKAAAKQAELLNAYP
ncbi:MAG: HU family DNA-binding protein [Tannerellaceae bacterium]